MHLMLISPIMILLFALTLGGLWLADRRRYHLLLLAGGFACFAGAFLVQMAQLPPEPAVYAVTSATLYAFGAVLASLGIAGRTGHTGIPPPVIVPAVAIVVLVAWYSYVDDQLLVRVYVQNFGIGLTFLAGAWYARGLAAGSFADRVLFWLLVVLALHFFPRTLLSAGSVAGVIDPVSFGESPFWTGTVYVSSIFGVLIGLALVLVTVADLVMALQRERDTDALTGTLNRRGLETSVRQTLANPDSRPVALIACDIDHFKRVNDQLGHHAGDLVLKQIGATFRAACRAEDVIGRIGGEEFVIVLPRSTAAAGYELAERLRHAIAATSMTEAGPGLSVTCSFGVAELRADEDLWAGLRRADRLLYAAKHAGRDRTAAEGRDELAPPMPAPVDYGGPRLVRPAG